MNKRYVLLDRDGTIIVERHYLSDPDQVELLPGAGEGLRALVDLGFGLIVVTNQSGIGRGFFDENRLSTIHDRMRHLLAAERVRLDGIYFCPHTPEDRCDCRKPRPGLVNRARSDFGFDPADAYVIGDKPCDIELAANVGAHSILVRTGYGQEHETSGTTRADAVVDNLPEAARLIARLIPTP